MLRPAVLAKLQAARKRELEGSLLLKQEHIAGLEAWERELKVQLEQHAGLTKQLTNRANNTEDLLEDIARTDKIHKVVAEKVEYLKIERKGPDRVRRLDEVVVRPRK